ncbi:MAG: polysaccharide biosynthesis protein [Lachnospiraceae bacterium]|nr:polysaccharide biosynthesis protein [Lachnospiraceae bacterium]
MRDNKGNTFYIQGTILAAASIITRILGLIFRIPLTDIIGDEGNGAYSNAYEIYSSALLLSTYSIPVAVSRLVSAKEAKKEYRNSFLVFKVALVFSFIVGLLMAFLVYRFAGPLSTMLFKSESSAIPLRALAPTIFVFAVMGVLRGFYQGKNTVIPTSISQILEQIVHVGLGLFLASRFMKLYAEYPNTAAFGAAGGTLGTLAGAVASLLFLLAVYCLYRPTLMRRLRKDRTEYDDPWADVLKMLLLTAVPIIINQFLFSVTGTIDSVLFNNVLAGKGVDETVRNTLIGIYSGKFRILTNVPIAIASAIGVAIIPNIVSAYTKGTRSALYTKMSQAIKFNMLIAIPCAAGLMALATPIMAALFPSSSERSLEISSQLMMIGGTSVIFFAYSTTTNNILQGLGKMRYPVFHAIIGIVIYLLVDFPLLKFTTMGVYALPVGYMVFPLVVAVLNFITIARETGYDQELLNTFIKPFVFSGLMGVFAFFLSKGLSFIIKSNMIVLAISVLLSIILYAALIIFSHTIDRDEMLEFPMGGRIVGLLSRLGIRL